MTDLAPLRIGVTGSRFYASPATIHAALVAAHERARPHSGHILIHGQCDPRHPDTMRAIPWERAKLVSWEVQRCYFGADWLAEQMALDMDITWEFERYPADWAAPCRSECKPNHRKRRYDGTDYCPAEGVYRNQRLVDTGADEWEVFIREDVASSGTADCARRAAAASIPVFRFRDAA